VAKLICDIQDIHGMNKCFVFCLFPLHNVQLCDDLIQLEGGKLISLASSNFDNTHPYKHDENTHKNLD
jgi:ABC-type Na+ transport system ATPase subunit NatA